MNICFLHFLVCQYCCPALIPFAFPDFADPSFCLYRGVIGDTNKGQNMPEKIIKHEKVKIQFKFQIKPPVCATAGAIEYTIVK